MISSDSIRVVTGIASACIATGLIVLVLKTEPAPPRPDAEISPSVMRSAVESGVDLSSSTPQQNAARLLDVFKEGQADSFDSITFRNGLYLKKDTDEVFSGYLFDSFDGDQPRLLCAVVDGQLQGPAVEFFETGELKRAMRYKDGRVISQVIEFYQNGQMKLRLAALSPSPSGGTRASEITVGKYTKDQYKRKSLGTGRFQFIYDSGTVEPTNELTPINEIRGWMLFYDTAITGQKPWTTDSRKVTAPDAQADS